MEVVFVKFKNFEEKIKNQSLFSQEFKKLQEAVSTEQTEPGSTIQKTFNLADKYDLSDNFHGIPLKNLTSDSLDEFMKNLNCYFVIFTLIEFIKKFYPEVHSKEFESSLKNSTCVNRVNEYITKVAKTCNIPLDSFDNELSVFLEMNGQKIFENLYNSFLFSILFPISSIKNIDKSDAENLHMKIPEFLLNGDIDSVIENIILLHKIETSLNDLSSGKNTDYFLNKFSFKESITEKIGKKSLNTDIKKYLDKNFLEFNIKKHKKSDFKNFIFNEKVSKVKVNKIFKEMKELETDLNSPIFDWNALNSVDFKVFYNLLYLIYINSSSVLPLERMDFANPLRFLSKDNSCPDAIISALLSVSPKESFYLEGNAKWNNNIITLNIKELEELGNNFEANLKEMLKEKDNPLFKEFFSEYIKKNLPQFDLDSFFEPNFLEKFKESLFLLKERLSNSIVSKNLKIKGFPLLGLGLEEEIETNLNSDTFDKLFVVFDKNNIESVTEKLSLFSQNSIAVFAVPKIFLSAEKFAPLRRKIAETKKLAGIIRLKASLSPIYFKNNDEYYLLILSGENETINLMDQVDFQINDKGISYFSYKVIKDFKDKFNSKDDYTYLSWNEFENLDLEEIPFIRDTNYFLENANKGLKNIWN